MTESLGGPPLLKHPGTPSVQVHLPAVQHATLLVPAQPHATNGGSHTYIQLGTTPPLNHFARGFGKYPRETACIWSGRFIAVTSLLGFSPWNGMTLDSNHAAR